MSVTSFGASILEQPNRSITKDEKGSTCEISFKGSYAALVTKQPNYGDTLAELADDAFKVTSSKLGKLNGNEGTLDITLFKPSDDGGGGGGGTEESLPTYEVRFEQISRPLELHPYFLSYGIAGLTEEDLARVEDALGAKTMAKRQEAVDGLGANGNGAVELYNKKRRGIDSYNVYIPAIVSTTYSNNKPILFGGNRRETPPPASAYPIASSFKDKNGKVRDWIYLRMPDQASKEAKRWRITRTWMGFTELDELLYPE